MENYTHLTDEERYLIEFLNSEGATQKSIAELLDRNPGTISREIKNRSKKKTGEYDAKYACQLAYQKRKYARFQGKKINDNEALQIYILKGLILDWPPAVIAGRMKKENKPFYASKTAIYEWLRSPYGSVYRGLLPANFKQKKKRKAKKTAREMIPGRVGIEARPARFEAEFGHLETDTIVSGKNTGGRAALTVTVEPLAGYVQIRRIPNMTPTANEAAVIDSLKQLNGTKSLTRDNGLENKNHGQNPIPSYFCHAYHSWEKPHVENMNKQIRFYVPKGSNIDGLGNDEVEQIQWLLNNKPRRSLDWRTPNEVMMSNGRLKYACRKVNRFALNHASFNRSLVALQG